MSADTSSSASSSKLDRKVQDNNSFDVQERAIEYKPRSKYTAWLTKFNRSTRHAGEDGEDFDAVPESNRRIGPVSAVFLIVNRMVGTGVFATPASIVGACNGSIGLALILWVIGSLIAFAGLAVYLEFATSLPRSGGEKNYLEFFYRKPLYLITCVYAAYAALLGWPSGNSVYAGTLLLNAGNLEATRWRERGIGVGVVLFALLIHGVLPKWGLRLQNVLGIFKVGVLLFIIITGFVALGGHVPGGAPNPSNFTNAFDGAGSIDASNFVNALYSVIWAFIGYSNIFYALSEVRNPIRTAKLAAPLALGIVAILYLLVNIAFFAAVPKDRILDSNRLLAAEFFGIMFGDRANRAVSVLIALSAIGNSLSVLFSQGRINQELGRSGTLPFSKFFGSNKPFNTPFAGLALQAAVTLIIMLAPPGGDIYGFLLNTISYPLNIFNVLVSFALIVITLRRKHYEWSPPIKATLPVTIFFFCANVFLVIVPMIKPAPGSEPYSDLPYYLHVVVGFGILGLGALYWLVWAQILPRIGGYKLVRVHELGPDGLTREVFSREKIE
ncbi:hypothetical protein OIO90_002820 [Microbotryomycetes sp. JL221]|nr:hypothetical protein OIO90_002820 [Microbotryomycetes sp. JL221]